MRGNDMSDSGVTIAAAGARLRDARAVVVMLHGRGGSADDILSLAGALRQPDLAYIAPRAPGRTWYPQSFLAPIEENEPSLSQSLATITAIVQDLSGRGIASHRVALVGFSQGGCLAIEFAARNAKRYAGIAGLSAGLIGPPGLTRDYQGSLAGTPVFLGCSDVDLHVPLDRVRVSTQVLTAMNAAVTERIYPGMGHTINQDEIVHVRRLLEGVNRARAA
jgi:phospholipase/carboxylesterase